MSFIEELKRRNVFKVGIAYLVGSWILVQVADILFENIGTPAWVMQTMLVFIGIGFFAALFFAWAFEMTPEGVKRESEVDRSQSITPQTGKNLNNTILVLMALAIAYLLFDKFSRPDPASTPAAETAKSSSQQDAGPVVDSSLKRLSIAVLPFDNRSNREEDQFFTDGIHDDLLTTIARIGSMKVISRTSVMEYKNTTKKIPEIARELGVATILEGGIQRSGDQVRINVQLIDAQTDEHLWAEIFDRELTAKNLFAIQSEISQKIADALKTTLTPEETRRINTMPTQDLAAYDAYMRGKQLMATRESAKLEEATREFRKAVDLDPQFALAWVGIADSHSLLTNYGTLNSKESLAIQQDAVSHALEIDPDLGEAHVSLAQIHQERGEYEAMDSEYKKAIELSPNYATAYHWYARSLDGLTRIQEAVELSRKAAELDPRSAIIAASLAGFYSAQGLYSRAEQQYKTVIELNPGFPQGYQSLAFFYGFTLGRYDLAIQNLQTALKFDSGSLFALGGLSWFAIDLGDLEAASKYRQMMAEINDQDWRLGWVDMKISEANGSAGGIHEAWKWASSRTPNIPFFSKNAAQAHLASGDPAAARRIYMASDPNWTEPEAWTRLIDSNPADACLVAWTFSQTGDEALGVALLEQARAFITRLPSLVEHDDSWNLQICYLMSGETEKALADIETQLAHNHLFGWKTNDKLPMYEQIRFEPRYQAAMAERDRRIAEQRKVIEQMNLEAGP